MEPHYFAFSTEWRDGQRLCRACGNTYDGGGHIESNVLKPYTKYVCSAAQPDTMGHSAVWSGSRTTPELRSEKDAFCVCGAPYVEQDKETWRLSWEMIGPFDSAWHPVEKVASRHETHGQHAGLLELIEQGEQIRNVRLVQLQISEVTQ